MPESDSRPQDGRTLGLAFLAIGAALHLLFLVSLFTQWLNPLFYEPDRSYGQASDFFGIYQAGDNLTRGAGIYSMEGRTEGSPRAVPYFYFYRYLPPTAYVAAISALLLRPWPSYWLWVWITEALLALMIYSLSRLRAPPAPVRAALAGLALGFTPFYVEQWMGQFSLLMASFIWITFWPEIHSPRGSGSNPVDDSMAAESKEESTLGLLRRPALWSWSASIALKNHTVLFAFPLLRQRRWRSVILAAALVTLACLPYFLIHPHELSQFRAANFRRLSSVVLGGSIGLANLLRALAWHLPDEWTDRLLALGPFHVYAGNVPLYACGALIALLSLWITWRMSSSALPETMALWVLTFFLAHKEIWEYHYVMLIPVVWLLAVRGDWRWPLLWGALLAFPTPYILYRGVWATRLIEEWPWWVVLAHFSGKVIPTIGLYALCARRCLGEAGRAASSDDRLTRREAPSV